MNNKAKSKALELTVRFITGTLRLPTLSNEQAKACALILVDEIIESIIDLKSQWVGVDLDKAEKIRFYQDVKTEIELI